MKPYGLAAKKKWLVGCCPGHDEIGANKFGGSYHKSHRQNRSYQIAKKLVRVKSKRELAKMEKCGYDGM